MDETRRVFRDGKAGIDGIDKSEQWYRKNGRTGGEYGPSANPYYLREPLTLRIDALG